MPFGVQGLKKTFASILVLSVLGVFVISCGGGKKSTPKHVLSGLKYRAFVSNPLFGGGAGGGVPVMNIVNAINDKLSPSTISLLGTSTQPSLMAVSPDLARTMVFSPSGNTIAVIDNATEAIANIIGSTSGVPAITLPGLTESMFIAQDGVSAYAAVPTATILGASPGAVVAINLGNGAITATIPVAGAHYIVGSPDGNSILVFSDGSNNVTVISTPLIGVSDPRTVVTGTAQAHFDRPVWAIFTDNTDAYIFNCGAECGGVSAGVTTFTIGNTAPGPTTPVSAATYGILDGSTLYVAGSPPHMACGAGTAAPTCGILTTLDADSLAVTKSGIVIPDGYHNRMGMGYNGQLFVGSHGCSNVNIAGGEVRGCLGIYNTLSSSVVVPPQTGDATGIQPIAGQTDPGVVFVCQGGVFTIYSTTTDQLFIPLNNNGTPTTIVGQAYDVKVVDPPSM
jgi:hypothetical protein